ncbi:hypothetical protein HA402_001030 [Bradysia odoriphaga]|nr:hypothetical protein HA402_001030 [Bradysia odoriphaga]
MLDTCTIRNNLTLTAGVIIGGITTILLIRKGAQLFSKITKRTIAEQTRNKCHVCNIPINLDNTSDFVTCDSCKQSPICRNLHCAIWSDKSKVWNCKLCRSYLHGTSSACDWLISQLNERLLQGKGNEDHSKIVWSSNDDSAPLIPLEQREKVREFVEELVSTLVGGSIDSAPVGQLFENKECKLLITSN